MIALLELNKKHAAWELDTDAGIAVWKFNQPYLFPPRSIVTS